MTTAVRAFARADYPALVAASNACYPEYPESVAEVRHRDESFDGTRFFRERIVAMVTTFIAIGADGRWLGVSNLERRVADPTFVWQGLTGVRRDARGRGSRRP